MKFVHYTIYLICKFFILYILLYYFLSPNSSQTHPLVSTYSNSCSLFLKAKQKQNRQDIVCFMLHNYTWAWGCPASDTSLKKTDISSARRYPLQISSLLRDGICSHFPFAILRFYLALSHIRLAHDITVSVISYMHQLLCESFIQKCQFSSQCYMAYCQSGNIYLKYNTVCKVYSNKDGYYFNIKQNKLLFIINCIV